MRRGGEWRGGGERETEWEGGEKPNGLSNSFDLPKKKLIPRRD